MRAPPSVAYIVDPRFPGGTSAAVAAELREVAAVARVRVHAIQSRMFHGRDIALPLAEALHDLGLDLAWDSPSIGADLAILHNPVFLKFQDEVPTRIIARHLAVVTHENFLRPGGAEAFDVGRCLGQIDRASLALRKSLAPVSPTNRATVRDWLGKAAANWTLLPRDWFNICDFVRAPPASQPADRRGRLSRPGFEKFPSLADLDLCFPDHARANVILGADALIASDVRRPHWTMIPFAGLPVARFFGMIDFLVHFTAPTWRESFGRVMAEAIAAGKVVISDAETAAPFAGAVVPATPAEVDAIVARFVSDPALYQQQVRRAQACLDTFSAREFRAMLGEILEETAGAAA